MCWAVGLSGVFSGAIYMYNVRAASQIGGGGPFLWILALVELKMRTCSSLGSWLELGSYLGLWRKSAVTGAG